MLSNSTCDCKHDQVVQADPGPEVASGTCRRRFVYLRSAFALAYRVSVSCALFASEACIRCAVILRAPRTGTTVNSSAGALGAWSIVGGVGQAAARARLQRLPLLGGHNISNDDAAHRSGAGERGEINPELAGQFPSSWRRRMPPGGIGVRPSCSAPPLGWVAITAGVG